MNSFHPSMYVPSFNEATAISCGDLKPPGPARSLFFVASTRPQRLAVEIGGAHERRSRVPTASTRPQRLAVEISAQCPISTPGH